MPLSKVEDARAAFLHESSLLLAVSSPSTSAYLTTEHISQVLQTASSVPDYLRYKYCIACGSLNSPGWTTSFTRPCRDRKQPKTKKRSAERRKTQPFTRPAVSLTCHVCYSETTHALPSLSKVQSTSRKKQEAALLTHPAASPAAQAEADRSTGKKRPKARKERMGLHALLNKSKQASTPSTTLDLMDFLKA